MRSLEKNNRGKKRTFNGGQKGVLENFVTPIGTIGEGIRIDEDF